MSKIQVLSDSVARRIAAGEVIERPVSVVKELVENSLDAGARRVTVEIDQGGRSRISVTDDGEGMVREDVSLAFRPHATSKIRSEDDLLRVSTLGFRGEALPSIAAVAEVELWTRSAGEPVGTHLRVRGGEILGVEDVGTGTGCRVEVRNLFFNTPVRQKFLKSTLTEGGHVAQLVSRLALTNCDVGFTLLQDGREALALMASDLRSRLRRVFGREIEREMIPIQRVGEVLVDGLATHPHYSHGHSRNLLFFVNGRLVRDRVLLHAILSAYATLIPHGRFPAAALFLSIAPEEVDVNVHPTKLEIRFRRPQTVHEAIGRAIRGGLGASAAATPAPEIAERAPSYERTEAGRSAERFLPLAPPAAAALVAAEPSLFSAPGPYSSLRVVGQVFSGYIVCEGADEVVVIDQHAAHERVTFERLCAERRRGRIAAQVLLVPQAVELTPGDVSHLEAAAKELAALGLEIESFGENTALVRAVPAICAKGDIPSLLRAVAADLAEVERSRVLEGRSESVLATVACLSAVRVGQALSEIEIQGLLAAMDSIDLNTNCPHGRPVTTRLLRSEIERRFGR